MKLPKAGNGQYIVLRALIETGQILNNDDTFYENTGDDYYEVLESLESALARADELVKGGHYEIVLYNGSGEFVKMIRA